MMKAFYVPESLNLELILPKKWHEPAIYFIHLLHVDRVYNRRGHHYVPLKSLYLRRIMGRYYRLIINRLIKCGIVETDHQYIERVKCYGYRLTDKYYNEKHLRLAITSKKIIKRLENVKKFIINHPTNIKLCQYLNDLEIAKHEGDNMQHQLSIDMIQNKDFFYHIDENGRSHTNITNLKKTSRKHLSWRKHKLVNIDISNAQPLFLGLIVKDWLSNKRHLKGFNSSNNKISHLREGKEKGEEGRSPYGARFSSTINLISEDLEKYLKLCEDGKLYEYLMIEMKTTKTRDEFKEYIFKSLIFSNPKYDKTYEKDIDKFKALFPTVYECLTDLKKRDYKRIAHLLQKAESKFIIYTVCERIMNISPNTFMATIHDSIITTEEDADLVENIIYDEFALLGVHPTIKREKYEN